VEQDHEYNCEYAKENECGCGDDDKQDDGYDEEICEYECYMSKGMEYCVDRNPYNDDEEEEEEEFALADYAECQQYEFQNNDDNRRKLEEDVAYYVGPYCADQGGKIYLGLFSDETCTQFADEYGGKETFASMSSGKELPYSESTMVGTECMSCKEPEEQDDNDNDQEDEDEVKEVCETLYTGAGKCEAFLDIDDPNNNACNYMSGIKISRRNGVVVKGSAAKNKTASVFIGLFTVSFFALGGYVYHLKTNLNRAQINLSE